MRLKSTFLRSPASQQQISEGRQVVEVGVRVRLAGTPVKLLYRWPPVGGGGGTGGRPSRGGRGGGWSPVTAGDVFRKVRVLAVSLPCHPEMSSESVEDRDTRMKRLSRAYQLRIPLWLTQGVHSGHASRKSDLR